MMTTIAMTMTMTTTMMMMMMVASAAGADLGAAAARIRSSASLRRRSRRFLVDSAVAVSGQAVASRVAGLRRAGGSDDHRRRSGFSVALCSMGMAVGDPDNDLRPDFYFTNVPDPTPPLFGVNPLMLQSSPLSFAQADAAWGVSNLRFSWGTFFFDVDNDADHDLYVNNETTPNRLYVNPGAPPMVDRGVEYAVTGTSALSFSSAMGDLDRDGDLDIVINNYGSATRLLMNKDGQQRNWLRLRVAGPGRVRNAIGAIATLQANAVNGSTPAPQRRPPPCW
jgi:hypothetical protein